MSFETSKSGVVICEAENSQGKSEARASVDINDLDSDFIVSSNNEQPISIGDDVSVVCSVAAYKYATDLKWFKDGSEVQPSPGMYDFAMKTTQPLIVFLLKNTACISFKGVEILSHDTQYSYRKELRWKSINATASGTYVCKANVIKDDSEETKTWELNMELPKLPKIEESNFENGKTMEHLLGEPLKLSCLFSGIPKPRIVWYKDDDEITTVGNDSRITLNDYNSELYIKYTKPEDEGNYKCVAVNRIGSVEREATLKITSNY